MSGFRSKGRRQQQRRPGGFNPSESDFNDRAFIVLQQYEGADSRGNTDERQHEDSVLVQNQSINIQVDNQSEVHRAAAIFARSESGVSEERR